MRFDNRVQSGAPPTRATSLTRAGQYTIVEVWANRTRFRLAFDRYLNIVSIQRFTKVRDNRPNPGWGYYDDVQGVRHWWGYTQFWRWRSEFHRSYKGKGHHLKPLHVDLVCCALEKVKAHGSGLL
jgi:hypothetical protein